MNQSIVEAGGEVGKVYTTKTGMSEANSNLDEFGWEQVNTSQRICVVAEKDELAVHGTSYVWRRVNTTHN